MPTAADDDRQPITGEATMAKRGQKLPLRIIQVDGVPVQYEPRFHKTRGEFAAWIGNRSFSAESLADLDRRAVEHAAEVLTIRIEEVIFAWLTNGTLRFWRARIARGDNTVSYQEFDKNEWGPHGSDLAESAEWHHHEPPSAYKVLPCSESVWNALIEVRSQLYAVHARLDALLSSPSEMLGLVDTAGAQLALPGSKGAG